MSSPISLEEQRRLHRQSTLNAQLGIVAAILGLGAAYLGFREAAERNSTPQVVSNSDSTIVTLPTVIDPPPRTQATSPGPITNIPSVPSAVGSRSEPAGEDLSSGFTSGTPISVAPAPAPTHREPYVNAGVVNALAAQPRAAILVLHGGDDAEHRVLSALDGAGFNARTGVFTSAAFRDGVVDRLAAGDAKAATELGLSSVDGHLIVGRLSFDPVQNTMQDLMMTHASLSVRITPLRGGSPVSRSFRARGAGFNESAAIRQAEDRVVEELMQALSSL